MLRGKFALTLICLLMAAGTAIAQDLTELQAMYQRYLTDIDQRYGQQVENWKREYRAALKGLEHRTQKAGNLEALLAVRNEQKRFVASPLLSDSVQVETPQELRQLQESFADKPEQLRHKRAEDLIEMVERYEKRLDELQRELTTKNRIDDALAVKAEREALRERPEVTAAEFTLAVLEESPEAKAPSEPVEKPAAAAPAPHEKIEADTGTVRGISIHPPSDTAPASRRLGFNLSRLPMYRTPHHPLRTSIRSTAYFARRRDDREHWHLRLKLQALPSVGIIHKPMVTVQYFIKQISDNGNRKPEALVVKRARLEALKSRGAVTIDYAPVSLHPTRHMTWNGRWEDGGQEVVGIVLSIYDYEGNLLLQETSHRSLRPRATPNMPGPTHEERYEQVQTNVRDVQQRIAQLLQEAARDPDNAADLMRTKSRLEQNIQSYKRQLESLKKRRQIEGW